VHGHQIKVVLPNRHFGMRLFHALSLIERWSAQSLGEKLDLPHP
jgi:hypothetical protein